MPTTEVLTHLRYEVLKAIANGLVTGSRDWAWTQRDPRDKTGRARTTVTATVRSLIEDGLVRVDPDLTHGRRTVRVTQAGYVEISRAHHTYTRKKTKKK